VSLDRAERREQRAQPVCVVSTTWQLHINPQLDADSWQAWTGARRACRSVSVPQRSSSGMKVAAPPSATPAVRVTAAAIASVTGLPCAPCANDACLQAPAHVRGGAFAARLTRCCVSWIVGTHCCGDLGRLRLAGVSRSYGHQEPLIRSSAARRRLKHGWRKARHSKRCTESAMSQTQAVACQLIPDDFAAPRHPSTRTAATVAA